MFKQKEQNRETTVPSPQTFIGFGIDKEVFKEMEKSISNCSINENTTALQVAYNLGIQAVLKYLRDNYVR